MIEMWDGLFSRMGFRDYDEMHEMLAGTWAECYRILVEGGICCINIGDALRKLNGDFKLHPNHVRVIENCERLGFKALPYILWKKPTNKPNAFLGSGFLPPNAYVTLDCEFVLIFRKGKLRSFPRHDEMRYRSTYTKAERDLWFSQIWDGIKGERQKGGVHGDRSAAFPEELAYRLIRMFSCEGETVVDPFCGTGTTLKVARDLGRDVIGYEIEEGLVSVIMDKLKWGRQTLGQSPIAYEIVRLTGVTPKESLAASSE
jgi:site-specific DNA-methyltransferase (cytosine-N4-specific)